MSHVIRPLLLLTLVLLPAVGSSAEPLKTDGPLAKYVAKADDSYRWVKRQEGKLGVTQFVELTLTSQKWQDTLWKHQLFIFKPSEIKTSSHALLYISGGAWRKELEAPIEDGDVHVPGEARYLALVAEVLKSPVALLRHVPQQPMFGGKYEDGIIAHTFAQYLKTGDSQWPLLAPMVKSAVRGMDATQAFTDKEWSMKIKQFTVSGASKRGWTTWLTGAVDRRAVAIAPMVIDTLNMAKQMKHQMAAWGRFSEQIEDYTKLELQKRLDTPPGKRLMKIVDPYSYLDSLKQPKLILIGTNDRYWPLDALNHYWNDLQGDKYILYVPNNGHGLRDFARLIGTINALHQSAAGRLKLPKLTWKIEEGDGGLHLSLQSDQKPRKVRAWVAHSESRDFREAKWESYPTRLNGKGHEYKLARPAKGYRAIFGEAVFDAEGTPYFLSTNVKIIHSKKTP
jgi:PhoPQ-activated pathogenicity-related protein